MGVSFRTAVFNLCKKMASSSEAEQVRNLINNLSTVVETKDDDPNIIKRPPHGDLSYIGSHQRIQFLGYLFADESVDEINKKEPFSVTHLDGNERQVIEGAYNTLRMFLDACISDIKDKYPNIGLLVDPYSRYRQPSLQYNVKPLLSKSEVKECVEAFKLGKLYKKTISNEVFQFFESVDTRTIHQLIALQEKQFANDMNTITKETEDFYYKVVMNNDIRTAEIMMMFTSYCYALRQSLGLAIQMLYEAIIGLDMPVMNNENIIDLANHINDIVYEKYVILTQGVMLGFAGSGVGSVALLTCDPSDLNHIKEFGEIIAMSVSFAGEFGSSSKVTMITVDEELNPIHRFTDAILGTPLGQSPIVVHKQRT